MLRSFSLPFHLAHGDDDLLAPASGIALSADPDQDVEDLIRDADAAMYRAKEAGGGRLMLFDEVTRQRALTRLHTERALRVGDRAARSSASTSSPRSSVETGAIVGLEALVRWEHPERGLRRAGRVHRARRGDRADRPDRHAGC